MIIGVKCVITVHGFKGKPSTNWKPWLKKELESAGFHVDVPEVDELIQHLP